ncbi:MAG: polyamine aminopropyltransferase [Gammaproteobacteria bacterium]|nr:polyamine aminopropyltransferase [Gammaproteobacteria bacterium]
MHDFKETLYPHYGQWFSVDEVLYEQRTEHFHLIIFTNARFGRVMALDGIIQTTERDEFIYHEMLAHVPILAHGQARRVLIVGGGDGAMAREVLRHATVEHLTQVEIDAAVIETAKRYLPNHCAGAFDDPRLQLVFDDGARYVNTAQERFDVIISDATDPIGPGEALFSEAFYAGCKRCLAPGGVLVAQNGVPFLQGDEITQTAARLMPHFTDVAFYAAAVPTYVGGIMTFAWASDTAALRAIPGETIAHRFAGAGLVTRYYTPATHHAAFALPAFVKALTAKA